MTTATVVHFRCIFVALSERRRRKDMWGWMATNQYRAEAAAAAAEFTLIFGKQKQKIYLKKLFTTVVVVTQIKNKQGMTAGCLNGPKDILSNICASVV